ncbi:slipin family protein [Flavihumibacter sp. CACIAM 22H1]|uniref:slipin family protein n=1 Tax=Flavihumibacter sp. CACIAM 22H1 TaxID=1812911 RepID=UPI0007A7D1EA|nr:slipin family protein [Flavihumibacter sp. CACIAM 22H1]KYP13613.1 MAG: peptidase [Flavihumibacter sp. CACIAM 22H1]
MKYVKVNAYQIGLVFRKGALKQVIKQGNYWFWKGEEVGVYDTTREFIAPVELNILLAHAELRSLLELVEVKDNELVLQFVNGMLTTVLKAGRYTFWKGPMVYQFIKVDAGKPAIAPAIDRVLLTHPVLAPYLRSYTVENYEKAVLFMDGKFEAVLDSGVYYWWKNGVVIQLGKVDIRQLQLEINGQEILTKDKAALRLNAWAQYRVVAIEKALLDNKEYERQLYITMQLVLREYVAGLSFDELLEKRETIAPFMQERISEKAAELGVELAGFGIRDIILPGEMKEIMNQVLVAEKRAQANTIMRREETASTRSLLNTAKLMEENAMLWKLKEMEYVEKIAEKISHISVNGNGKLVEQLKEWFTPK